MQTSASVSSQMRSLRVYRKSSESEIVITTAGERPITAFPTLNERHGLLVITTSPAETL